MAFMGQRYIRNCFFENLLLDKHHDLKNRYLHLECHSNTGEKTVQSADEDVSKGKKYTLNCTLDELVLLKIIKQEPTFTQKELALQKKCKGQV